MNDDGTSVANGDSAKYQLQGNAYRDAESQYNNILSKLAKFVQEIEHLETQEKTKPLGITSQGPTVPANGQVDFLPALDASQTRKYVTTPPSLLFESIIEGSPTSSNFAQVSVGTPKPPDDLDVAQPKFQRCIAPSDALSLSNSSETLAHCGRNTELLSRVKRFHEEMLVALAEYRKAVWQPNKVAGTDQGSAFEIHPFMMSTSGQSIFQNYAGSSGAEGDGIVASASNPFGSLGGAAHSHAASSTASNNHVQPAASRRGTGNLTVSFLPPTQQQKDEGGQLQPHSPTMSPTSTNRQLIESFVSFLPGGNESSSSITGIQYVRGGESRDRIVENNFGVMGSMVLEAVQLQGSRSAFTELYIPPRAGPTGSVSRQDIDLPTCLFGTDFSPSTSVNNTSQPRAGPRPPLKLNCSTSSFGVSGASVNQFALFGSTNSSEGAASPLLQARSAPTARGVVFPTRRLSGASSLNTSEHGSPLQQRGPGLVPHSPQHRNTAAFSNELNSSLGRDSTTGVYSATKLRSSFRL